MFKTIGRIDKLLLLFVVLTITGSQTGCEWFPVSTFKLGSESRLPRWIILPQGLARTDASITMSYYAMPWGRNTVFVLQDAKGQVRTKVRGKTRGLGPSKLKHPPQGFSSGYPAYEVITVNGITEIIEHKKPEPIFYVADDPSIWKELGVTQK